ncbi:MAG: hypothetical protein DMF91_17950 [Acidobacteria bacterium]|nr:MAG: hypothetical protein DMF91_17950 [Acidobacteriota bacterium]
MILPLLALLVFSSPAAPQAGTSRTTLVTVADARNQPIVDVGPDDVVIREGPAPPGKSATREILSVHSADYPVIVLIDNGSAARDDFSQIRKAVGRFVDRLGRRPVAIGTLGDPPALLTSFDDEPEQAAQRLDALTVSSTDSVLLQAVAMAAQKLRETGSIFSAIVVVSASGSDRTASKPEELIGPIVDSGAIIHVVANRPPATVPSESPSEPAQMLRIVVQQTLGQLTVIYAAASYQAALDRLADRMSSELMIEYLVPPGSKASDVKVGVRIPGARVRGLGVRPRD